MPTPQKEKEEQTRRPAPLLEPVGLQILDGRPGIRLFDHLLEGQIQLSRKFNPLSFGQKSQRDCAILSRLRPRTSRITIEGRASWCPAQSITKAARVLLLVTSENSL